MRVCVEITGRFLSDVRGPQEEQLFTICSIKNGPAQDWPAVDTPQLVAIDVMQALVFAVGRRRPVGFPLCPCFLPAASGLPVQSLVPRPAEL